MKVTIEEQVVKDAVATIAEQKAELEAARQVISGLLEILRAEGLDISRALRQHRGVLTPEQRLALRHPQTGAVDITRHVLETLQAGPTEEAAKQKRLEEYRARANERLSKGMS